MRLVVAQVTADAFECCQHLDGQNENKLTPWVRQLHVDRSISWTAFLVLKDKLLNALFFSPACGCGWAGRSRQAGAHFRPNLTTSFGLTFRQGKWYFTTATELLQQLLPPHLPRTTGSLFSLRTLRRKVWLCPCSSYPLWLDNLGTQLLNACPVFAHLVEYVSSAWRIGRTHVYLSRTNLGKTF